jgi:hypothetical protein
MNIQNKLKDLKDQKRYSIPAKRLNEHLKPILSKSNELRKRWMWELLQNASDLGDETNAEFEFKDDKIIFRHNGKPFTLDEAFNLIMPDSTKDDENTRTKSVIGQFGTGFISTHILSKRILVKGIVEDSEDDEYFNFKFKLDRSERKDKDFLIQSIKDSEKEYGESLERITNYEPSEFDTEFTYFIKETYAELLGSEAIDEGFDSFHDLIPFVFAFRPQLKRINIKDKRNSKNESWTFKREELDKEIEDLTLIKTVCKRNGEKHCSLTVGTITDEETTIAIRLEQIENEKFEILPFPEYSPKLYCAFPMIGTTEYNFPVVVHSESFVPNRERDGIEITTHDEENRKRLIEAKNAFCTLIDIAEENEWTNCFNLFNLKKVELIDNDSKKWFIKNIFKPLKGKLYESKLIELDGELEIDDYRKPLNEICIPYFDKREANNEDLTMSIYDFSFKIIPEKIPKREHLINWYNTIDFEMFANEKFGLKELLKKISDDNLNFESLDENYSMSESESIDYLKDLVVFVLQQEEENLLNEYSVIPNQNDVLVKQKKLSIDNVNHKYLKEGYAEKLKEINRLLTNNDCKDLLLHPDFEIIENLIEEEETFDFKELAKQTDDELRNYEGNFQDEDFLKILKDLFHWFTNCGISEDTLSNYLPYFSLNKSQLYLNTKSAEELEYAFDIEISGKSEVLAKIANNSLKNEELEIIAENPCLVSSFISWLNHKQQDNPDEELGDIGEEFLNFELRKIFGKDRVLWENKSEYDFRILNRDLETTQYYIDAKTTAKGIANTVNVPFYMRTAQWNFLEKEKALNKYLIARVYKKGGEFGVKYMKIKLTKID